MMPTNGSLFALYMFCPKRWAAPSENFWRPWRSFQYEIQNVGALWLSEKSTKVAVLPRSGGGSD